jgi:hypothetical protein
MMPEVGRHMIPLNGRLLARGPASPWPPRQRRPPGWPAWRHRIFIGLGIGAAAVTVMAFIESFTGLVDWARHHGLHGLLALIAPLTVDTFILGGEAVALIAIMENWQWRFQAYGYGFALAGLAASVAGNVGRDGWAVSRETMATYAVAPLAMFGFLWLGLVVVKRYLKPAGKGSGVRAVTGGGADTGPDNPGQDRTPGHDRTPAPGADTPADKRTRPRTPKAVTGKDRAADMIRANPDMSAPEIAAALKVDPRTVRRWKTAIREDTTND